MPQMLTVQDVKVRRDVKDLKTLYYIVLGGFILLVVGLGFLWCRNRVTFVAYEISQATARRDVLQESNKRHRIELERYRNPQRIEKMASEDLGLVHPSSGQIVRIK